MRHARKIGRRTWLARTAGGALAAWTGLRLGGRDGWAVSIGMPPAPAAHADDTLPDIRRVELGQNGFVSAYVVVRGSEAAIVDTGVAGSAQRIAEVMQEAGIGGDAIHHLILTHHHSDHTGSLDAVLGLAQNATVWAGAPDIPRIRSPRPIVVAEEGADIFGLRVLSTPGHTLGHISVIDDQASTLIVGDALVNTGALAASPAAFSEDLGQVAATVRKLAAMSFERALFMHGDPIDAGASAAFGTVALGLPNDAAMLARYLETADACCQDEARTTL